MREHRNLLFPDHREPLVSAAAATLGVIAEVREAARTAKGARFFDSFMADYHAKRAPGAPDGKAGAALGRTIAAGLSVAEPFHVQPQMVPLVRWAADSLPEDAAYSPQILPAPAGFAYFPQPYPVADVRGDVSYVGAISWQPMTGPDDQAGILMCWWADASHPGDSAHQHWVDTGSQAAARHTLLHIANIAYGRQVGQPGMVLSHAERARWESTGDAPLAESSENSLRLPLALFNLLGQDVVTTTRAPMTPGAARAWSRRHLVPEVVIVHLRAAAKIDGESPAGIGHQRLVRWIVRGHWRSQAHGPAYSQRRLIWIAPHLAGPEDAPLSLKTHVFDLAR